MSLLHLQLLHNFSKTYGGSYPKIESATSCRERLPFFLPCRLSFLQLRKGCMRREQHCTTEAFRCGIFCSLIHRNTQKHPRCLTKEIHLVEMTLPGLEYGTQPQENYSENLKRHNKVIRLHLLQRSPLYLKKRFLHSTQAMRKKWPQSGSRVRQP